jgi:hypothetical protein
VLPGFCWRRAHAHSRNLESDPLAGRRHAWEESPLAACAVRRDSDTNAPIDRTSTSGICTNPVLPSQRYLQTWSVWDPAQSRRNGGVIRCMEKVRTSHRQGRSLSDPGWPLRDLERPNLTPISQRTIGQSGSGSPHPPKFSVHAPRFLTLTEPSRLLSLPSTSGSHPRATSKSSEAPTFLCHCLGDDIRLSLSSTSLTFLTFCVTPSAADFLIAAFDWCRKVQGDDPQSKKVSASQCHQSPHPTFGHPNAFQCVRLFLSTRPIGATPRVYVNPLLFLVMSVAAR